MSLIGCPVCAMRQVIPSKSGLVRSDHLRRCPAQLCVLGKKRGRERRLTRGPRVPVIEKRRGRGARAGGLGSRFGPTEGGAPSWLPARPSC